MNRAQRVLAFLEQRPHVWIAATTFEPIGGRQAWRTALSEARQLVRVKGGDIENRVRTGKRGDQVWTISEYRFVPADPVETPPAQGHDGNTFELR